MRGQVCARGLVEEWVSKVRVLLQKERKGNFILGSSSIHRLQILKKLKFDPAEILSPDIDESPKKNEIPRVYAQRITLEKSQKLSLQNPGNVILTADTVACCGRRILPKAISDSDVKFCLNMLSGKRHRVYTAICIITEDGKFRTRVATTILKFKRLTEGEVNFYISTQEGIGKAGGYSIQGLAQSFIIWMRGNFSSVIGLPAYETVSLLKSAGVKQG